MPDPSRAPRTPHKLGVFALSMLNVAAIATLRDLPAMAEYGLSSITYCLFVAAVFMIPISLVSAELATGFPQAGGVHNWVRQAFGPRWGFVAIWLQWIQNVVWYPVVLSFAASTLAYALHPELAQNCLYIVAVVLAAYWTSTLVNFRGLKASSLISTLGVIVGTLLPAIVLIGFGAVWWLKALPRSDGTQLVLSAHSLLPDVSHPSRMVLALSMLLTSFVGMEMPASHAQEVRNPQRDYPRAILIATVVILGLAIVGTTALIIVIPPAGIDAETGVMRMVQIVQQQHDLPGLVHLAAVLIAFGLFGQVTTWVPGPSKGLLAVGRHGFLPRFFQQTNRSGMQTHILLVQAAIVTVLSLVFMVIPSVETAYTLLMAATAQIYLLMYIMMFAAAIRLRYSQPDTPRAYRVPGGNSGMWCVAGTAIAGAVFTICVFYAPQAGVSAIVWMGLLHWAP
ncbi:Glutamate/gamma-aminobutyrate antiporter [Bremerella volcania]|uniref:Glutamate/gamma-aminobutyrate antiporter n=1 Tax=Bremerella volcania TaxID=2527984 RepID=A0A518C5T3_9BACT|nr:amino acid permease [Bremerella volcania]QDU74564.1 Glutamate/gamma-aminobutyrate antiporter [Bremerella volcania]